MDGPGRPTLYRPEFAEQAYGLCLLGATNRELADHFGVARSIIHADRAQSRQAGAGDAHRALLARHACQQ